jgi:trimeric autotransporter adhesin
LTPAVNLVTSSSYTALNATSTATPALLRNRIAVLNQDLAGQATAALRIQTIGTSPNQTLVVQWKDYQNYLETGQVFNGQIRLNETSNTVDLVYGTVAFNTSTYGFQVGLSGNTNADYNNRSTTTNWNMTTAGTTPSATCRALNTVTPPVAGLQFTYTAPSCLGPLATTVSAITTTAATVSWTAPSPVPSSGYEYVIGTTNTVPTGSGTAVTGTTFTISTLADSTIYYVFVRSNCGSSFSTWAGPIAFSTLCVASNVPYSQNFESVTVPAIPQCTLVINAGSGNAWNTAFNPGSGFTTNVLNYSYNSTNPANTWFFTRGVNLTAGTSYRIAYNYGNNSTFYAESLKVAYGTSATVASMTNPLADHPTINQNAIQYNQVDFTPTVTGIYYFGFQAYSIANLLNLFVDNITVDVTPLCNPPLGLTATNITVSSTDLSWTAVVGAVDYQYVVDQVATNPVGAGTTLVPANFAATGLMSNTTYYLHVRTNCGAALSPWSTSSFTTLATPPANDTCAGAITLNVGGTFASQVVSGAVLGATTTSGVVPSCQSSSVADVWYSVVVPASGSLTIETQEEASNSITDSVLAAFSGSCGSLTSIGCDDDAGAGNMSLLSLTGLTPGATIYIGLWKYNTLPTATANTFKISAYDATLGTESFDLNGFASYPNPVTDFLNLSYTKNITKVAVHNLVGQEIMTKTINATQSKIDMSNLSNGTYLVKVTVDGLEKTLKVLKQ